MRRRASQDLPQACDTDAAGRLLGEEGAFKKVTVTPLPNVDDGSEVPIVIHEGAAGHESEAMSAARARVRERLSAAGEISKERHTIVERTLARLEKVRPDRLGLVRAEG